MELLLLRVLSFLFNWELVALHDIDGNVCIRKVVFVGRRRFAWRMGLGVHMVELLPDGKLKGGKYVSSWDSVRKKRGQKH